MATRRYAELFTFLQTGRPLLSLNQFLYGPAPSPRALNRRLLDLTAVRYLIVDNALRGDIEDANPPFRRLVDSDDFSVYENPQRLPRAFYAPRIEVVHDPAALLTRLVDGTDDLHQVALVDELPPSGFQGSAASAPYPPVRFEVNESEEVVLQVEAAARGFVVLTDQYFPGWSATVDGVPTTIERADYAFRLVEVPAGKSTVRFVYSPRSLWLGAAVSAVSWIGFTGLLFAARLYRKKS
jgi:hypothetical protein